MKFRLFGLVAVFIFISLLVGCMNKSPYVTIVSEQGSRNIQVEVASTDEEKRVGLMGQKELPEHSGMLFIYDEDPRPVMWMKHMLMSIDIVFIGEDRKISHIERSVPPCEPEDDGQCARYSSSSPSFWILELPAGYTMRHGIKQGDEVVIPSGI